MGHGYIGLPPCELFEVKMPHANVFFNEDSGTLLELIGVLCGEIFGSPPLG